MKLGVIALRFALVFGGFLMLAPAIWADGILADPLRASTLLNSTPTANMTVVDDADCPTPDGVLTLEKAIVTAVCRNPETARTWANVRAGVANVGSARSAYLPSLSASAGIGHNYAATNGSTNRGSPSSSFSPGVNLSMLLLDFGGRSASVDATAQALLAADYTHNSTLQTVMNTAVAAYYNMASAEAGVKAALDSEKSANTAWQAAKTRVSVGVATPVDELQARSTYGPGPADAPRGRTHARYRPRHPCPCHGVGAQCGVHLSVARKPWRNG
jgi:outer membrane protein TolC